MILRDVFSPYVGTTIAARMSSRVKTVGKFVRPIPLLRSPIDENHVISITGSAIVDEDRRGTSEDIVRVDASDGEVVHRLCPGEGDDVGESRPIAGDGAQRVTGGEVFSVDSCLRGLVPDPVAVGGVDDRGRALVVLDGQVGEVRVLVDMGRGDLTRERFPGFGVGGQDCVPDHDILDQPAGAISHQDQGGRRETVAGRCRPSGSTFQPDLDDTFSEPSPD